MADGPKPDARVAYILGFDAGYAKAEGERRDGRHHHEGTADSDCPACLTRMLAKSLADLRLADELAAVVTEFTGDDPKFDDPHPIDTALTRYHAARLSLLGEPT